MANWLERAKREIQESAGRTTAITAERNLTSVMAVPKPGESKISLASNGSNGSANAAGLREIEAANNADVMELKRLVRRCGELYGFTKAEHRDALEVAMSDSRSALLCFRSIAGQHGLG